MPPAEIELLTAMENAIDALIAPESLRREFFTHEQLVRTLYRAVKPDRAAFEFAQRVAGVSALADAVRAKLRPDAPDISAIMASISGLLDQSITGQTIREGGGGAAGSSSGKQQDAGVRARVASPPCVPG